MYEKQWKPEIELRNRRPALLAALTLAIRLPNAHKCKIEVKTQYIYGFLSYQTKPYGVRAPVTCTGVLERVHTWCCRA